jgi:hypothetical protein
VVSQFCLRVVIGDVILRWASAGEGMDEKISNLFQEWLSAFSAVQVALGED